MKHRIPLLISLAVISLAVLGVACATVQTGASTATPSEVNLTDDNNGQRIELRSGQTLIIGLKGNPGTGYTWEVKDPLAFLQQDGEPTFKADSQLLGAPGRLTFRFKPVGTGEGKLTMIYHRPWEKGVEPINTYSIDLVVK